MFCLAPLTRVASPAGDDLHKIMVCRGCQEPNFKTYCRELYLTKTEIKLYDSIQIDEFIITRLYRSSRTGQPIEQTKFYKDSIGQIDSQVDATPLTYYLPICELDYHIKLPLNDLGAFKRKLKLWTIFS